jgi:ubiquinone/menaquinone biosynthesis C-methylase UbiE
LIERFYNKIKKIVSEINIESVLEIGCGLGYSTEYLYKIFKDIEFSSSDIEQDLLIEAEKRNPRVFFKQESIYELERNTKSIDLLIVLEVLEHLREPVKALKEIKRVSKQYCLISVPREPLWRVLNIARGKYVIHGGNTPGHINHWSRHSIVKLIERFFTIEKVFTPVPWTILLCSVYT